MIPAVQAGNRHETDEEKGKVTRVDRECPPDRQDLPQSGNEVTPSDIDTLLVSAVRYALGRQSYIVGLTCDIVRRANPNRHLATIILRDIEQAHSYGMEMDRREWFVLKSWLESRIRETHSDGITR